MEDGFGCTEAVLDCCWGRRAQKGLPEGICIVQIGTFVFKGIVICKSSPGTVKMLLALRVRAFLPLSPFLDGSDRSDGLWQRDIAISGDFDYLCL